MTRKYQVLEDFKFNGKMYHVGDTFELEMLEHDAEDLVEAGKLECVKMAKTYRVLEEFTHDGDTYEVGKEFVLEIPEHKVKHLLDEAKLSLV